MTWLMYFAVVLASAMRPGLFLPSVGGYAYLWFNGGIGRATKSKPAQGRSAALVAGPSGCWVAMKGLPRLCSLLANRTLRGFSPASPRGYRRRCTHAAALGRAQ